MKRAVPVTAVALLLASALCLGREEGDEEGRPQLPDRRAIDTILFSFDDQGYPGEGSLRVTRSGEVRYSHATEPGPGGHRVVSKQWSIPGEESVILFDRLVREGLLELEDESRVVAGGFYRVRATCGRWQIEIRPRGLPEPLIELLLPLLREAHPEKWGDAANAAVGPGSPREL